MDSSEQRFVTKKIVNLSVNQESTTMTKEERLKYCSVCKNKKLDFDRGLICSLTDENPTFEGECESIQVDVEEQARKEQQSKELKKDYQKRDLYNDLIFCLIFSYFSARGHGIAVFIVSFVIVALCFVVSNCVLIQYEKKKGKELSLNVRSIIKDAFALLIVFLLVALI